MRPPAAGNSAHSSERGFTVNGPFAEPEDGSRLVRGVLDKLFANNPRGGAPPVPLSFIFDGQHAATPPKMLVKEMIPADGVCFLGGQSGAGKTFILVNLAVCLASQTPFFGRIIRERVGVAIIAAEGAAGLPRRIEAAKAGMDINHELPIAWCGTANNLLDPNVIRQTIDDLRGINQQMIDLHGVRLGAIAIDTIGAAFCLEDENNAARVRRNSAGIQSHPKERQNRDNTAVAHLCISEGN
jgi:AAA domain